MRKKKPLLWEAAFFMSLLRLIGPLHPVYNACSRYYPGDACDEIIEELYDAVFGHAGCDRNGHDHECVKEDKQQHGDEADELADFYRQPRFAK